MRRGRSSAARPVELGAPTADQTVNGDVVTQKFNGGAISWNKATNAFTTEPPACSRSSAGLEVPGRDVPQAPPTRGRRSPTVGRRGCIPTWWWLLGVMPVLVLVGAVAAAVRAEPPAGMTTRPRSTTYDDDDDDEHDDRRVRLRRADEHGERDEPTTTTATITTSRDAAAERLGDATTSTAHAPTLPTMDPTASRPTCPTTRTRSTPPRRRSCSSMTMPSDPSVTTEAPQRRRVGRPRCVAPTTTMQTLRPHVDDRGRTRARMPEPAIANPSPTADRPAAGTRRSSSTNPWSLETSLRLASDDPVRRAARATRSRPTRSRGCTGRPAAGTTTTRALKSGSPVKNSR